MIFICGWSGIDFFLQQNNGQRSGDESQLQSPLLRYESWLRKELGRMGTLVFES